MKRAELDRRIANGETLDDIVPALMDDGADITSYDDLKRFAIEKIESDGLDGNGIGKIEARHAACDAETHTRERHHRLHRFSGLVR